MARTRLVRLVVCVLAFGATSAESREFRELQTEHFVIYSDLSEHATRQFADDISALQAVVGSISSVSDFKPAVAPMRLYALSEDDWKEYIRPRDNVAGFHFPGYFDRYIVFNAETIGGRQTALHEYVHYVVSNTGSVYPAWFNEGLADSLATIEQTSRSIRVGTVRAGRAAVGGLPGPWIPIERLVRIKHGDQEFIDSKTQRMLYAESWAMVHMHLMGETTPMMEYLRRVAPGAKGDIDAAFNSSFRLSYEQMDAKVKAYIGAPKHNVLTIDRQRLPALVPNTNPIVKLDKVASDYELAELTLVLGLEKEEARDLFESVLQRDPQHAAAWSGLAESYFLLKDLEKARAALDKALASGPKEAIVLRRAAYGAIRNEGTRAQGLEYYRQALANDPKDLRTIVEYATAALAVGIQREEALRHVTAALRAAPKNWVLARSYAALLTALGRPDQARVGWQVVARYTSDERLRDVALRTLEAPKSAQP